MTLTERHVETLREAPFVVGRFPGIAHDLCRKGLLHWTAGAWRLTPAGQQHLTSGDAPSLLPPLAAAH